MAKQQANTISLRESARPITEVALYARVSTLNNQDPEMQLAELREYATRRGWQVVEEFTDQGVSGCKESRPALNRLMSDACRRRFDAVLVWKIGTDPLPSFFRRVCSSLSSLNFDLFFGSRFRECTVDFFLTAVMLPVLVSISWTQINLQLCHDRIAFSFRNLGQQICNQVLLTALAENHAIDRERTAQPIQTFYLTAERQRGDMSLDFCVTGEEPIGHEIIFMRQSHGAAHFKHGFPCIRVAIV